MSKAGSASKIKVTSFNDLFGNTDTISESRISNDVREIPLTELYEFKNHPFHADADKLEVMAGSINNFGVFFQKKIGEEFFTQRRRAGICGHWF